MKTKTTQTVKPLDVHLMLCVTRTELEDATTYFGSSRDANSTYCVSEVGGRVYEWNDFDVLDSQLTEHDDFNSAVESIISGCEALFLEFHDVEQCEVTRNFTGDGLIIGFCLSHGQSGDDETFGNFRG